MSLLKRGMKRKPRQTPKVDAGFFLFRNPIFEDHNPPIGGE
jgi:hypothetical protein